MNVRDKVIEVVKSVSGIDIIDGEHQSGYVTNNQMHEILYQLEECYEVEISDNVDDCLAMDIDQFISLVDSKVKGNRMSETVHYRGIAKRIIIPEGQTTSEVAKRILDNHNIEVAEYYDSVLECFSDNFSESYFYHKDTDIIYELENNTYEPDADIIIAKEISKGVIEYELRYYNGGAGFDECLEEAIDKLKEK